MKKSIVLAADPSRLASLRLRFRYSFASSKLRSGSPSSGTSKGRRRASRSARLDRDHRSIFSFEGPKRSVAEFVCGAATRRTAQFLNE